MREREQLAKNLSRLLKDEDMTQRAFAEKIQVSPITVNKWVKGRMGMSEYSANVIHGHFPKYSVDFIRGFSEHKNEIADWLNEMIAKSAKTAAAYLTVSELVEVRGFNVEFIYNPESTGIGDDFLCEIRNKRGEKLLLTYDQWGYFGDEVLGYLEMRLNAMFKRGEW